MAVEGQARDSLAISNTPFLLQCVREGADPAEELRSCVEGQGEQNVVPGRTAGR